MSAPVRIVIADDHPMFSFGLRAALDAVPEIDVVGVAATGPELVRLVGQLRPAVVLTDLEMPGASGANAIAELAQRHPEIKIVVLTMHADDAPVLSAVRAGASGYLLKGAEREEIARAVLSVAAGGTVYGGEIGRRLADYATRGPVSTPASAFPELTPREAEVLGHVAAGRGNHEIAAALLLSEKTVRNHVATILAKLQLRDRAAAVARARDRGLGVAQSASSSDGRGPRAS
ncbi:response regulator transcription factor [Salinibacterium sp. ZJ454]|uniref:response regulator n=1 Tax=Salinibacterium sp. ZJ454 TaxID=2708339 RepID=UPI00141ECAF3|nr:response regulator transcription factor [Salinibacterium sp. ZJ454]